MVGPHAARDTLDELAASWAFTDPGVLAREAGVHLARMLGTLRVGSLSPSGREQLLEVAADLALLRGHAAVAAGQLFAAGDLFTLARSLADQTGRPELASRALGSASTVASYIGQPRDALDLLDQARAGAEAGLWRLWVELAAAKQHATLGDHSAAWRALEAAYDHTARGDGFGFLSRQGYFAGLDAFYLAGQSGLVLGLLGATVDALAELGTALAAPARRARATGRCYVDTATVYAYAGAPEMACESATEALDECGRTGYGLGLERVRQLRAGFPPTWVGLECVRQLDERLRLI
jgi:hypothetical protein